MKSLICLLPILALTAAVAPAAEHRVDSAADLARVVATLQPGDTVVLADGTWRDQALVIGGKGTAEQPITFRAATPGRVVLTGNSSVLIDGEHLVVSGLLLQDGGPEGDAIAVKGSNCRLTECAVIGGTYKFHAHLFGTDHRVDHCYFADKANGDPTFQIEVELKPNNHRIDHNHFGPRPPLGRNGGETMRIGYSWQSMLNSRTVVEHNLFDRCDGEIEIISSKSCENVYRGNTFLDCAGMLTLRHGNRCMIDGNFFLGRGKRGSGGIRVIGDDHVIVNNYIEGVEQGAFWIHAGVQNSELIQYFRARGCTIAFNTVVASRGPTLHLDAGMGTANRTLRPQNITIANNLFAVPDGGQFLRGVEGEDFHWAGNFVAAPFASSLRAGIALGDPKLVRGADGLWRPAADSPVRGAAAALAPAVPEDIDGQPRPEAGDVGCDQLSDAPVLRRPLTAVEVGPPWLERR